MPGEALRSIEEAEKKAEELIWKGRADTETLLKDKKEEARGLIARSEEEAHREGQKVKERLLAEAKQEVGRTREEFAEERRLLEDKARGKLEDTSQYILERAKRFWIEI